MTNQDPQSPRQAAAAARRAQDAATALQALQQFTGDPTTFDQATWAQVANLAGQLQRRSRQLAGLGRGG